MKTKLFAFLAVSLIIPLSALAQLSTFDLNKPFGWCVCKSLTETGFELTGGGEKDTARVVTLTSKGVDQGDEINTAIQENDIIILDGSKGDFIFKQNIYLQELSNKTIVGINNARLCTEFYITPEIAKMLDDADVSNASTAGGTGGVLTNGSKVGEQREYLTRLTLMNAGFDDAQVRSSGVFSMVRCSNVIIRNLSFVGPGPIDVGGNDLLTLTSCTNMWIDHCSFTDGIDGNFDINAKSNFITVSWCVFAYTDRAYDHMNTNLIGSNDKDAMGEDLHNVTFANCMWGYKCNQRMPMARNGIIHLLNDYYNCAGNSVSVNPRMGSRFIVEGVSAAKGVNLFSQRDAVSCSFSGGYYENGFDETSSQCNFGERPVLPYAYKVNDAKTMSGEVARFAGATLVAPI